MQWNVSVTEGKVHSLMQIWPFTLPLKGLGSVRFFFFSIIRQRCINWKWKFTCKNFCFKYIYL